MQSTKKTQLAPEDAFGRVIRERRLALGLTQADLEGEGGLERSYISRLEAGQYQVCLRGILHLARSLKMTSAELMREVEKRLQGLDGHNLDGQGPEVLSLGGPGSDGQSPDGPNLDGQSLDGPSSNDQSPDISDPEGQSSEYLNLDGPSSDSASPDGQDRPDG